VRAIGYPSFSCSRGDRTPLRGNQKGFTTIRGPDQGDLRYHWVQVRLDAIDEDEMRELVLDA
jgi:hypothetical protein